MIRFLVAISLIICLAVAVVSPQQDSPTDAKATDTAAATSQVVSSDDSNNEEADAEFSWPALASLFSFLPSPFFPSLYNFYSPLEFLTRPNIPEDFDIPNCRLTVDLSSAPKPSTVSVDLMGRNVLVQITSSTSESNQNSDNSAFHASGTTQEILSRSVPSSCLVVPEKIVVEFNKTTKVLTLTFPAAPPSTNEEGTSSDDKLKEPSEDLKDMEDDDNEDDDNEDDDNEDDDNEDDDNEDDDNEDDDNSAVEFISFAEPDDVEKNVANDIDVNFMSRPVSVIE